jgi:GNAT superfamily N-acetyltransferase
MNLDSLVEALQRNYGNTLTPELALGLLNALQQKDLSSQINLEEIPSEEYQGFTIKAEYMGEILDELKPLHAEHWKETEKYRHGLQLNPDYGYMIDREQQGRFMLFTVRQDELLVGNCMMYLSKSTHTQKWVAEEDTIFILPEYRKGRLGVRLIRYVDDVLRNMGISEIRVTTKTVNSTENLMKRLGYTHTGNQLTKVFEE